VGIILVLIFIGFKLVQPANQPQKELRPGIFPSDETRPKEPQSIKPQSTEPRPVAPGKTKSRPTVSPSGEAQQTPATPTSSPDFITIEDIDNMEGKEFEFFLKVFFQKQGYSVEIVPPTRSNGVDVIIKRPGNTTVIRVKRQAQPVDRDAIEQVRSAKASEKADGAWVITNNSFTDEAEESASKSGVRLFGRDDVIAIIGNSPVTRNEFHEKYEIWRSYR
jgi:restriction system protein